MVCRIYGTVLAVGTKQHLFSMFQVQCDDTGTSTKYSLEYSSAQCRFFVFESLKIFKLFKPYRKQKLQLGQKSAASLELSLYYCQTD